MRSWLELAAEGTMEHGLEKGVEAFAAGGLLGLYRTGLSYVFCEVLP